jgi:dTDP-4-dehydrorhamnose reductase
MTPVLITGSKGQLGSEIQLLEPDYPELSFYFTDLPELDITHPGDILRFLDKNPVQYIVNCAGYTAVDAAEDDSEMAFKLNAEATETLGKIAVEKGIQLIHISTDYVFDGEKNIPYVEDDRVNPQSVYGESKLKGEESLQRLETGIIIRTSWLYSAFGNNFVKTMIRLAGERDQLSVVFDQTGCPTYARDLAKAILQIIQAEINQKGIPRHDIFHFSSQGMCSWYEFARSIMNLTGEKCSIKPVLSKDYSTKAKRPRYSVMSKAKIMAAYDIPVPHWKDSLKDCIQELTNV